MEHKENGQFAVGHPGGPGRPKGGALSIKERINQYLRDHPDEMEAIVKYFVKSNRELLWQMLEGRPQQDVTSGGDKLIPNPIFGGLSVKVDGTLQEHDSDQENFLSEETNPSS
jgi:hypothetical protein